MSPETVPVVTAVVERGGAYLICQRPIHKRHGGLWDFPGGKVDPTETVEGDTVLPARAAEVTPDMLPEIREAVQ